MPLLTSRRHQGAIVQRFIAEDRDICFGSFSSDGSALRYLLGAAAPERNKIIGFLNAGCLGEVLSHSETGPAFPVASAVWLCGSDQIDEAFASNLHLSMTGLMVVDVLPSGQVQRPALLPQETRERWAACVSHIIKNARLAFYRRHSGGCPGRACIPDAEAAEALGRTMEWACRFTTGAGYARTVLARAFEQILKIAALLTLDANTPKPVDAATVTLASELYRLLAAGTIDAESRHHEALLARDVEALHEKLSVQGPLTRRELVRSYHKQDYARINSTLAAAIKAGKITHDRERYRAVIR